jgi:hypothetical protein
MFWIFWNFSFVFWFGNIDRLLENVLGNSLITGLAGKNGMGWDGGF